MANEIITLQPIDLSITIVAASEANALLAHANNMTIKTPQDFILANDQLKQIKNRMKDFADQKTFLGKNLVEVKRRFDFLFKQPTEVFESAVRTLNLKLLAYQQEQERIRREAERKLQAEADAKAAKEREKLIAKAAKAEEKGNVGKAEDLRLAAEVVQPMPITVESTTPKITTRTTWRGECTDILSLARAVLNNQAPATLLSINQTALNEFARSVKDTLPVPGIKFIEEKSVVSR
jgi:hypothetical protein